MEEEEAAEEAVEEAAAAAEAAAEAAAAAMALGWGRLGRLSAARACVGASTGPLRSCSRAARPPLAHTTIAR